ILEWDVVNLASYGGLGPSIANQHTGEILSANVLIQGPTVLRLYTQWFGVSETIHALRAQGKTAAADVLLRQAANEVATILDSAALPKVTLSLGKLGFRIASQLPSYEDPLFQRDDFDVLPAGLDF